MTTYRVTRITYKSGEIRERFIDAENADAARAAFDPDDTEDAEDRYVGYEVTTIELRCYMSEGCTEPVTHVDEKGYVYCTDHGQERRWDMRCRKLRPHELNRLRRGEQLARY